MHCPPYRQVNRAYEVTGGIVAQSAVAKRYRFRALRYHTNHRRINQVAAHGTRRVNAYQRDAIDSNVGKTALGVSKYPLSKLFNRRHKGMEPDLE